MIEETRILTGIDVGTTKVCAIIGKVSKSKDLEILGSGVVPCDGLSKGNVANVAATQRAIRSAVQIAEQRAYVKVSSAYVGVTGSHVSYQNRTDRLDWVGKRGVITADDLLRVPEAVASASSQPDRKVIHAIPRRYSLDGSYAVRDPLGMHTNHIQVESHLVTGASSFISRLTDAVEGSGIHVEDLVLEPLASAEAVLSQREKDRGAALVDIGGGTSDVVVFKNGTLYYTGVIPVGGYQFTNDIVLTFNTPYQAAEDTKLKYATVELEGIKPSEEVVLPVMGRTTGLRVSRHDICQLTRERAQELARLIGLKLKEADVRDISEVQLVLTGGVANMPGLLNLMKRTLTDKVRVGMPGGDASIPDELRHPAYSTAVGILLWAMNNSKHQASANGSVRANGHNGLNGSTAREERNGGGVFKLLRQMKSIF